MAILGKDLLPNHGPYIDFVRRDTKLVYANGWPNPTLYKKDVVFLFADDLLGCVCSYTGKYCPFDPYELTQLSQPHKLIEFADTFLIWAMDVMRGDAAKAFDNFGWLNHYEGRKDLTGQQIQLDVSETLMHIAQLALDAAKSRGFLIIVGI